MIIVTVQLVSARTGATTELARMIVVNTGDGDKNLGNYTGATFRGRGSKSLNRGTVSKQGRVDNYPRLRRHVWNLVCKMLSNMGYGR